MPPQATKFPDGENATVITQAERSGMTWKEMSTFEYIEIDNL